MQNPIGQRLMEARKFVNLSQSDLADAVNITQSAISRAEKDGSISNELAIYMSKTHNIDLNWLFTGKGQMIKSEISGETIKEMEDKIMKLQSLSEGLQDQVLMLVRDKKNLETQLENKKAS